MDKSLMDLNSLMPGQEPSTQQISTEKLDQMCREMDQAWEKYDKSKKQTAALKEVYDKMEAEVTLTLRTIGKTKYFVEGIGNLSVVKRLSYKVPADIPAKEALFGYIRETYGDDVLKAMVSINSQKLNSWAKEENEAKPGVYIPGLDSPTESFGITTRK